MTTRNAASRERDPACGNSPARRRRAQAITPIVVPVPPQFEQELANSIALFLLALTVPEHKRQSNPLG